MNNQQINWSRSHRRSKVNFTETDIKTLEIIKSVRTSDELKQNITSLYNKVVMLKNQQDNRREYARQYMNKNKNKNKMEEV